MTSKVLYELLIRSYGKIEFFSQTWNLTTDKNTYVNRGKTKDHEKFNFGYEKIQKM